ncbi:MAG: esterase-like activity of phytase family protein [Sphingomonas sp.]
MRSLWPVLAALLTPASTPQATPVIEATPIALDRADPLRDRLGALRYLDGWELSSRDPRFGGLSSMAWRDGGLIAVSDAGTVFTIVPGGGEPRGQVEGALPAGPGTSDVKSDRDAESLTHDPATGASWIGFEAHNEIWRYDRALRRATAHRAPPAMAKWPGNGGPEAMIRLKDGRFLVFSEEARGPERSTALLVFPGDPTLPSNRPRLAGYRAPAGYAITDVTALPDGRLILLHRRFTLLDGVSAIVSLLDPATIRPGHAVRATTLAILAAPLTVDNMEAIATSEENGRTILWIASDDNFSPLQRTLLLKFAIDLPVAR